MGKIGVRHRALPSRSRSATNTSIGIAHARPLVDAASLFEQADAALYAAKQAGRGRYQVTGAAGPSPA